MKLKDWVRTARKHGKLTQDELGERLSLSKQNISAWETGRHEPSFGQLQTIANVTGYALCAHDAADAGAPVPRPVSPEERELLEAFRDLPEDEQAEVRRQVIERARKLREYLEQMLRRDGAVVSSDTPKHGVTLHTIGEQPLHGATGRRLKSMERLQQETKAPAAQRGRDGGKKRGGSGAGH